MYLSLAAHKRWQERTSDVNIWTALLLTHVTGHMGNAQTLGPFPTDPNNTVRGLWLLIQHQHICNIVIASSRHCWWKPRHSRSQTRLRFKTRVMFAHVCRLPSSLSDQSSHVSQEAKARGDQIKNTPLPWVKCGFLWAPTLSDRMQNASCFYFWNPVSQHSRHVVVGTKTLKSVYLCVQNAPGLIYKTDSKSIFIASMP